MILMIIALASCDKDRFFDAYTNIPSRGWHKDSIVSFDLPQADTTRTYNMFINLRTNDDYPFNNLFLIVSLDQPNRITLVDTLEYRMADQDGKMLGEGFSDVKESKLWYKKRVKFKKGPYKVHIQQALRETGKISGVKSLKGITEVGFRVENAN